MSRRIKSETAYYKNYKKRLFAPEKDSPDVDQAAKELFDELLDDCQREVDKRQATLYTDLYILLKDQKYKWNASIELAKREFGYSPIKRDAILGTAKGVVAGLRSVETGDFRT